MYNPKNKNKIVATIAIIIILATWAYYIFGNPPQNPPGSFELLIADEAENVLYHETLDYKANDKLYDVLKREFDLTCANRAYDADPTCDTTFRFYDGNELVEGVVILGIRGDGFSVTSDWRNTYLAIEVFENGSYRLSTKGVNSYQLEDGIKIRIMVTRVIG